MADDKQLVKSHNFYPTLGVFEQVELMLLETGGEVTPEIEKLLESLDADFDQLVELSCRTIREYELLGKSTKEEYQRLQNLKVSREKLAESLKKALTRAFRRCNKQKVHTAGFTVTLTHSPLSVEVDPGAECPANFLTDPPPMPPIPDDPVEAVKVLKEFLQATLEKTRSLDRAKVKEVWDGHKEYFLTLFTDPKTYLAELEKVGRKMTKEDLACYLANGKLPTGIRVQYDNYHVRIK